MDARGARGAPLDSGVGEVEGGCVSIAKTRRRILACFVSAGLGFLAACGGGDEKSAPAGSAAPTATATGTAIAAPNETVAFALEQEHRSGSSGTVTLKGGDRGFTVALAVKPKRDHPAHIHNVTCKQYRALKDFDAQYATVEKTLSDVAKGRSKTAVDAPLSDYRTGGSLSTSTPTPAGFRSLPAGTFPPGERQRF